MFQPIKLPNTPQLIKIHNNVKIAAGSIVTKNVKQGTVVGENPAKVIGLFGVLHENRKISESGEALIYDPRDRT